jgi:hypothetical protein
VLIKRYIGIPGAYYPPEEDPPIEGVVRPMWHDLVHEKDKHGEWRINRINYELCVLEALRCRELWVVGADKYRNPEDNLLKDFSASSSYWLVSKTVVPEAVRPLMISYIARRPRGSSLVIGSSGKSTGGDIIKQAARSRRRRIPPE